MCIVINVDHEDVLKKHADYTDAKENFLGKSFVAPGETLPIKRDLENKFDTVDIPVRYNSFVIMLYSVIFL